MKQITILGATGTIGVNTLDVIQRHPDRFSAFALTANKNVERLFAQCQRFQPRFAVLSDTDAATELEAKLKTVASDTQVLAGVEGLITVSEHAETNHVMAGIVGAAGLLPTLAAANAGKRVMLANKESLVMSGQLFMDAVRENQAELLPIDSEHNAIFQSMPVDFERGLSETGVNKILLTASGGPFRNFTADQLETVTPAQAVAHPNWEMGKKISVDSATMMNKGLEVIEACWLFHTDTSKIEVVIHPQSVIHSMVQYNDGSVLAQLGNPDMRTPIAYAMGWPERITAGVDDLNLFDIAQLDFQAPDRQRFPCLQLAFDAMNTGGLATTVLNAANEIAVDAFLNDQLKFSGIPKVIEKCLTTVKSGPAENIDAILAADHETRETAHAIIRSLAS